MDLQGALQQLQGHVRTQVEIVLTNLPAVATREYHDAALYNRFVSARQAIPVVYGQMIGWSSQLNNVAFAECLRKLADSLNAITVEVDAAIQQGVDETRKQNLIYGITNADSVMSTFLQQHYATVVAYHNALSSPAASTANNANPSPAQNENASSTDDMPPPPPDDDSPFMDHQAAPAASPNNYPNNTSNTNGNNNFSAPPSPQITPQANGPAPIQNVNPQTMNQNLSPQTQQSAAPSVVEPVAAYPSIITSQAMVELVTSEQDYIAVLVSCSSAYDSAFKSNLPRMKKLLSDSDLAAVQSLFSGLSLVAKCHQQFMSHLEAAKQGKESLGSAIKTMVLTLKVYTDFMTNLDNYIESLRKSKKNKEFSKFLDDCKTKSGSQFDVEVIAARTFKRLGEYDGLIKAFLVNLTPQDNEFNNMKESLLLVKKVAEYISQARSAMESRIKILAIQQRVSGLPSGLNLVAPHRVFLREQDMDVKGSESKKAKEMTVYSFNDMMLLTRIKGLVSKDEVCEAIISYHNHRIEPAVEAERPGFRMVDAKKGTGWVFVPPDDQSRTQWLSEVKASIEQLKNSRATALVDDVNENELQTKLQLKVIAGRDMCASIYDPPDLYVQVSLGANVRKTASCDKVRFNPEWTDTFVLDLKNPYEETLLIEVKDRNTETLIGNANVPLDDLYDYVEKFTWVPLKSEFPSISNPELFLGLMVAPNLVEDAKS